jgi:hypothetical protein
MRTDPPVDMTDIECLLAYEEIRQLAARYALAIDARDLDSLVELFVDDFVATFTTGSRAAAGRDLEPGPEGPASGQRGRAALRSVFDHYLSVDHVTILQIGGHVIDLVDRDHATGTVYCVCEMGEKGRWARQAVAYEDDYERRAGRWYFARRNHLLFYGIQVPERPIDEPPADWPASQLGRGSIPFEWPTWQAYWATKQRG